MVASVLKTQSFIIFLILFFITIISSSSRLTVAYGYSELFGKYISPSSLGLKREKLSHLHFYLHDVLSGKNVTAIRVVDGKPSTNSSSQFIFGDVYVIDDPLTIEPDINSKTANTMVAPSVFWGEMRFFPPCERYRLSVGAAFSDLHVAMLR
ncbi:hypothetical protein E1A91_A04G149000v1 [Gossypium mustelinum]|uniref:Dirigent protein n=1 Tax=Gossypium mustelinum TaxID=34275 RepID=A0A5D2ZS77_GOSMU|nr:hypothetical protein E1A91_A04G149000v1 [Gossypium mustelinum]